jgi:hypothetical protein
VVEDFDEVGKLGQGFSSIDRLEEVDLGEGDVAPPTYRNVGLASNNKADLCRLLKEFTSCLAWSYTEVPGLSRDLVEHTLLIKLGFKPFKQLAKRHNSELIGRIKEEVERLLQAQFIRTARYADWVSNIVLIEKKGIGKIRICHY